MQMIFLNYAHQLLAKQKHLKKVTNIYANTWKNVEINIHKNQN